MYDFLQQRLEYIKCYPMGQTYKNIICGHIKKRSENIFKN